MTPGPRRAQAPTPTAQAPAATGIAAAVPADLFGPGLLDWLRLEIRLAVFAEMRAGPSPAELRLAAGFLTTRALAKAAGVPRAMLSRYEQTGSKTPGGRGAKLTAIAACLGTTPTAYAASVRRHWERQKGEQE